MSKRKTIDKTQARERRNQLLASAAAAELSVTEGVREMRAISGMTQEEFAQHREVSARVIKALELGKGNPTVTTLNRIGKFFGLEVGFVPVQRQGAPSRKEAEEAPSGLAPEQIRKIAQEVFALGFSDAILKTLGHAKSELVATAENSVAEQKDGSESAQKSGGSQKKTRLPGRS